MLAQNSISNVFPLKKDNKQRFSWKEYFILAFAGLFGTIVAIPSAWSTLENTASVQKIPVQLLVGEQILQTTFWMLIVVGVGLFLAGKTGLGAPILKGYLNGERVSGRFRSLILPSVLLAILATLIVKPLDRWFFLPRMPGFSSAISQISGWKGFLASFYGGITEEILLRLFFLTLLAWILGWISHTADGKPSRIAMWIAILGSAILFGLGHLPATLASVPFSPIVLAREVTLNGIMGTTFGYLYWKRGLESSMMAHFSSDLLVHLILPFFSL